ncbi:MAG: molybdopterin-synthase adenylyltransferase MoeB, partial [Pseudomonadota bacterium]
SPAAMYLAASGVGKLSLNDFDEVELSNLQRQIAHRMDTIGQPKVDSAQSTINTLNPQIEINPIHGKLDDDELRGHIAQADVVLDCCDNYNARFAINKACLDVGKPLVSGASLRFEGQLSVFDFRRPDSPCYQCLHPEAGEEESCSQAGILAPTVGMVGCMQAIEAIKVCLEIGDTLCGRLLLMDTLRMDFRTLKLRKNPDCPACH